MKKILVKGPALTQSGYGVHCRYILRALRQFSDRFDLYFINTVWGSCGWIHYDNDERRYIDNLIQKTIQYTQVQKGTFDISVQVRIPSEYEQLAPINILCTAGIESNKISPNWFQGAMKFNKLIFTSNYAKEGFENTKYTMVHNPSGQQFEAHIETPMEVISYPVQIFEPKTPNIDFKYDFNYLVVAQWNTRKNIENTIKWFVEEFHDKPVGLILKIQSITNSRWDREHTETRLKGFIQSVFGDKPRKCAIHLLHGDMTDEEMTGLYQHPKVKCLISLGREGFGLPAFEAVYNGLPVITMPFGGPNDFIYMPIKDKKTNKEKETCMVAPVSFAMGQVEKEASDASIIRGPNGQPIDVMVLPDSQWAFPEEWSYKLQLRNVHKNHSFYKARAQRLQKYVCEKFEANKMYKMFADLIAEDLPILDVSKFLTDEVVNTNLTDVVVYD